MPFASTFAVLPVGIGFMFISLCHPFIHQPYVAASFSLSFI